MVNTRKKQTSKVTKKKGTNRKGGAKKQVTEYATTPKMRKKKEKLEVYVPRLKNKAFPDNLTLTIEQQKFFDENIFTDSNLEEFNSFGKRGDHRENKEKFVHKLVSTSIGSQVIVKRYNEEDGKFEILPSNQIVMYILNKFVKKKSCLQKISSQKKEKSNNKMSLQEEIKELSPLTRLRYLPNFKDIYPIEEKAGEFSSNSWNLYSMIHNLYKAFNLVVYSGSHLIKDNEETHRASRVFLKFPDEVNLFILFHGNLVHSGAAAKYEPHLNSMHIAADLRAFAYVNKNKNAQRPGKKGNNARGRDTHADNAAVGTTCKACPMILNRNASCKVCEKFRNKNIKSKLQNYNGFEIDVLSVYNEYKLREKEKGRNNDNIVPILGDLENDGWSIYEGIDTRDITEVGALFQDCRNLINEFPSSFKNLQQNAHQKSGRMRLMLGEHMFNNSGKMKDHLKTSDIFYKLVEQKKLKKINGFENCTMTERSLLYNKGPLNEQNIHKDYEPY